MKSAMMSQPKKDKEQLKKSLNSYLTYSGLAIQMGALIALGAYGGKWLDAEYSLEKPWFTIVGTLSGMAMGLYLVLRQVNADQ